MRSSDAVSSFSLFFSLFPFRRPFDFCTGRSLSALLRHAQYCARLSPFSQIVQRVCHLYYSRILHTDGYLFRTMVNSYVSRKIYPFLKENISELKCASISLFLFVRYSSRSVHDFSSSSLRFSFFLSFLPVHPYLLLGHRPAPLLIESVAIRTTIRFVAMRRTRPRTPTAVNSAGSFLSSISQHRLVRMVLGQPARASGPFVLLSLLRVGKMYTSSRPARKRVSLATTLPVPRSRQSFGIGIPWEYP